MHGAINDSQRLIILLTIVSKIIRLWESTSKNTNHSFYVIVDHIWPRTNYNPNTARVKNKNDTLNNVWYVWYLSCFFPLGFTNLGLNIILKKTYQIYSCKTIEPQMLSIVHQERICLFVLRFYGPVNPTGSYRALSVYLTTHLLGRLSPLSG